jgi:prevent-host-death family protein
MATVTMLQLRRHAQQVIDRVRLGERLTLTYRGRPVARLEPVDTGASADDAFYGLADLSRLPAPAAATATSLTNEQIDQAIYGQ